MARFFDYGRCLYFLKFSLDEGWGNVGLYLAALPLLVWALTASVLAKFSGRAYNLRVTGAAVLNPLTPLGVDHREFL